MRGLFSALVVTALLSLGQHSLSASELTIQTASGKMHGKEINQGKVRAFLGIPYAAPPVGNLRWRAPQPVAAWKGVREVTQFGAHCSQGRVFDDMIFQDGKPSEDCLFLNVYSPATATAKSNLPVMFWIHGGGFAGGASSEPRHNGDFLPLKGVILVTINYRLGVFGFLATSDLAKETGGTAGNYGLMDMIAGLQWVKANISKFGGDPKNVTIFGESAGSFAVSTLMASPMSQGLFQKAIGESGGAFSTTTLAYEPISSRAKKDDAFVSSLGVTSLEQLRNMPADDLIAGATKSGMVRFAPAIDGKVLTESVEATFAAGKQSHVPLLAGWNHDEGGFAAKDATAEKWKAMAEKIYAAKADEFLKLYPGDDEAQAKRSAADFAGDQFIAFGTWKWIEAHQKTGNSPIYRYRLDWPAPKSKFHDAAAFHSDDIEYVFGTLDTRPGAVWSDTDRKLSDEMMSYWTNFARTGDPNGAGLSKWPVYGQEQNVIYLDEAITTKPDVAQARYAFLTEQESKATAATSEQKPAEKQQ
jgi:para-nitrobenzyl esterase